MQFDSVIFFPFLIFVFALFYSLPKSFRPSLLLLSSLVFYAALNVPYLILSLGWVIVSSYVAGRAIRAASGEPAKKWIYVTGVMLNLAVLVFCRYLPFLAENTNFLLRLASFQAAIPVPQPLISIGVSFYVFQSISYLTDIRLEVQEPETRFITLALYLCFFPKLLQGPIERSGAMIPQLNFRDDFNYGPARASLLLFSWGLFKKIVIADRLALFVDPVFDQVRSIGTFEGVSFFWATIYYSLQIYCDFSGYTDMAIGIAGLFNVKLTNNFNRPYLATSIAEFWRRWHISFSSWIFDYIFKPLQMKWRNMKKAGNVTALMVTFLVSGIWHGASWTFIVWGLLHGMYLSFHVLYAPFKKKIIHSLNLKKSRLLSVWQSFFTFSLVSLAWIFFRARDLRDALYILGHFFSGWSSYLSLFMSGLLHLNRWKMLFEPVWGSEQSFKEFLILQPILLIFIVFEFTSNLKNTKLMTLFNRNRIVRWLVYLIWVGAIFVFGVAERKTFIYFRF
jgi:D-alanyl-lipoteichoic acid acyltransferase DltB (MBOAT superfamily)